MMGLVLTNDNTWMRTVAVPGRRPDWYYHVSKWCREQCNGNYIIGMKDVAFEKEQDAVFFSLVYSK